MNEKNKSIDSNDCVLTFEGKVIAKAELVSYTTLETANTAPFSSLLGRNGIQGTMTVDKFGTRFDKEQK